jgi:ligand-binding sensor domain-containing protein
VDAVAAKGGKAWAAGAKGVFERDGSGWKKIAVFRCLSLAPSAGGGVWAGTADRGLALYRGGSWTFFDHLPYRGVKSLKADAQDRVWFLPPDEEVSKGVVRFDGKKAALFDLEDDPLVQPSSLSLDPAGHVWVGTWSDGLYELVDP